MVSDLFLEEIASEVMWNPDRVDRVRSCATPSRSICCFVSIPPIIIKIIIYASYLFFAFSLLIMKIMKNVRQKITAMAQKKVFCFLVAYLITLIPLRFLVRALDVLTRE